MCVWSVAYAIVRYWDMFDIITRSAGIDEESGVSMADTERSEKRIAHVKIFRLFFLLSFILLCTGHFALPHSAYAAGPPNIPSLPTIPPIPPLPPCCATNGSCVKEDCDAADDFINQAHTDLRNRVKTEFDDDLNQFEQWLIEIMFKEHFLPAMAKMTTQMSAVAVKYTESIGAFLDAQIQMDTQRVFRKLQFAAHKDYRPSDDFCWFGTNVRSLASSRSKARFNALALSQMSLARQLGNIRVAGAHDAVDDYDARWDQFITTYCDPGDNNPNTENLAETGLGLACDSGAHDHNRVNRDIDYTRLIEEPRTIDLDFEDETLHTDNPFIPNEPGDEEDVIALSRNLYGHRVLSRNISKHTMRNNNAQKLYLALRSIAAKRGVAQASFNAIIGLKSSGTSHEVEGIVEHPIGVQLDLEKNQTRRYLAAIMDQLLPGDPPGEGTNIYDLMGYSPSYYSQLEILAKRIYQNPDFYANLYDTPANVARKKVAMKAIELMVDRAVYESQLRREMGISVLLAGKLRAAHRYANRGLSSSRGQ